MNLLGLFRGQDWIHDYSEDESYPDGLSGLCGARAPDPTLTLHAIVMVLGFGDT
jgi:hypothetical protein